MKSAPSLKLALVLAAQIAHGRLGTQPTATAAIRPHTAASDLRDASKRILIMTTASVPWLTGTAINPLLRAAHLTAGRPDGAVTLYLPWLEPERQHEVYKDIRFETRGDQARYVAAWVRDTAGMAEAAEKLRIAFYDAHYHTPQGSIYPMGRTVEALPRADFRRYDGGGGAEAGAWAPDVVVLEEPEHLNWYSFVDGDASAWRSQGHVVGVVHTHYVSYAATERACGGLLGELVHPFVGPFKAMMALLMSRWMTNGHCHRIVKLSNTLPRVGNDDAEVVCNVHGVRGAFLDVGEGRKVRQPFLSGGTLPAAASNPWAETEARGTAGTEGAYFIGKLIWQKGLDDLGRLLAHTAREFGGTLPGGPVHVVGDGLHRHDVARSFAKRKLPAVFHGRRDHAEPLCQNFRVLVNPSKTEVLCTTIAEALAMGKWVVIRKHPSNEFFYDFPTCLPFETKAEFATHYAFALRHEPPPLSDRMRRRLSWAAATDRFCDAAAMPETPLRRHQRLAEYLHCHMGKGRRGDWIRSIAGAGFTVGRQSKYVRERQGDGDGDAPPAAADAPVEVAV